MVVEVPEVGGGSAVGATAEKLVVLGDDADEEALTVAIAAAKANAVDENLLAQGVTLRDEISLLGCSAALSVVPDEIGVRPAYGEWIDADATAQSSLSRSIPRSTVC